MMDKILKHYYSPANNNDDVAWRGFWRLETIWRSKTLSIATKLRLFDSLVLAIMSYGSETWPINAEMTRLINSFATSAYKREKNGQSSK